MNAKTQNCSTVVQSHFTRSNRNNTQRRACNQTAPILQVTSQDENFFMSKSNKLEGDLNFIAWKVRIKFAFMRESVWYTDNRTSSTSTIEQDGAEVINTNSLLTSEAIEKEKIKALTMFSSVKDNIIHHIATKIDPAECWRTLHKLYESKNTARTVYLFDQLQALHFEESQSMAEYIRCTRVLTFQLQAAGEVLSTDRIVHTTLPVAYEPFIQGLMGQDNLSSFKKLSSRLLIEEQ